MITYGIQIHKSNSILDLWVYNRLFISMDSTFIEPTNLGSKILIKNCRGIREG
jgi:hypothetical protein